MASYTKDEAQEWAWDNLHGQWSTLVTPFTAEDTVDEAGLRHNIRYIQSLGTKGAGCGWGMGEFWSLTQEERLHVQDIVADESRDQWLIGSHVTDTSVPDMLELARHAEDIGFDLLIVAPSYMVTRTEEQVIQYTRLLAENSSLAIMFYNSPQFGIVMSAQGLRRICQIPNVVGVKEASFNQQLSIETHLLLGRDAIISTPDEWIFAKAKQLGFQQQVMFANTSDWRFDTPEENQYVQFIERATQGDLDQQFYDTHLKEIKQLSDKWWGATVKKFGGAMPVSLVKYWGELMGLSAGHVRPPLSDMTDDEKAELRRELGALRPLSSKEDSPKKGRASVRPAVTTTQSNGSGEGHESNLSGMLLMVSVQNLDEALEAERGGADLIDVKNLQEALVGSGHPMVVREIRERISDDRHVSVTLGVVPSQPGTVAMAVHAAAILNATSVKVGFVNTDYDTAVDVLQSARRALEGFKTKLIGSLFADNGLHDGLDPHLMLKLAREGECDGFLIDTLTKDGRNLFDFIPEAELREMVFEGKQLGLSTALSGHLKMTDLDELARINPDIVGVRGAVCASQDRTSAVAWEAVAEFKHALNQRKSGEVNPYGDSPVAASDSNGWVVLDGRGKSCAGVIAALTKQVEADGHSLIEALMSDALNIYDLTVWTEKAGHRMLTQRKESDGTLRVLIQPFAGSR
ncbi:MAG: dihydrodipicolinate synthase family protein [Chloroflexi bacterium]|nr:dihydrodipicolinate synthase family protein [Chloroflexota bacterium]